MAVIAKDPTPTGARPKIPQTSAPTPPTPTVYSQPMQQPKVATEGPGMMGQPQTQPAAPKPANDLRSQVFSLSPSGSTQVAQNMATGVAGQLTNYQFSPFQSINPANYSAARGYLGQAAGQVGGMNIGNYANIPVNQFAQSYGLLGQAKGDLPGSYNPAGDTTQSRQMLMQALQSAQAPDRTALALKNFDLLQQASEPQYQMDLRTVGQKNAALGRLGSGMVTNQLMDVTAQRQRDLAQAREQLASDAAAQQLADQLNVVGATSGVFGQLGNEDRANLGANINLSGARAGLAGQYAGLDTEKFNENSANRDFQFNRDALAASLAGQRANLLAGLGQTEGQFATNEFGQQQSERNAGLQYGLDQFGARQGLLNSLAGLEGQRFGQDATTMGFQQQERAFQAQQAQQAIDNARNQALTEDQLANDAVQRQMTQMNGYGSLGYGYDPSQTYMQGAGQYGQQAGANAQAAGQNLQAYSYQDWLKQHPEYSQYIF